MPVRKAISWKLIKVASPAAPLVTATLCVCVFCNSLREWCVKEGQRALSVSVFQQLLWQHGKS